MSNASVPGLASIKDPVIRRAFDYLQTIDNNMGSQANVAPVGIIPPPPAHVANSVYGGGGKLSIEINDTFPANRGAERFADVSSDASFAKFHTIHMGATHNWRGDSPVPGMAFVRTYSQYPTSGVSPHLYASAVDTAPATATAQFHSGNAVSGYGTQFNNSVVQPKRA